MSLRTLARAEAGLCCLLVLSWVPACREQAAGVEGPRPAAVSGGPLLEEISEEAGLPAAPAPRPDGTFFLPEIMGAGVAVLDYDDDGDLDILQVRFPPSGNPRDPAPNRLYAQRERLRFVDVTDQAGLGDPGYGQGVAVGDVDNDGDHDVYIANYGPDRFYRNNGDGSFVEETAAAGLSDDLWSSSATFCDYDRDGDLDLYVAHYLRYDFRGKCHHGGGFQDFCAPSLFDGVIDTLYRNEGARGFVDVSRSAGIVPADRGKTAKGLGVVCADLTGDGWADFFVANDGEMNHLWVNRGDGSFAEEAIMRGLAVDRHGTPQASMGVAIGDVDGDAYLDLFTTHVTQETNTLYRGGPSGLFSDRTVESGLGRRDLPLTGFGCALFDLDHDGDLDLAVANGRVYRGPVLPGAALGAFWNLYAEPNLLYENAGGGRFVELGAAADSFSGAVEISRGLAQGDLDNDGDLDLVLSSNGGGLRLFRNDAPPAERHWLLVRALSGPRDAVGARISVIAGEKRLTGLVLPGNGYQGSNDPRVHFGLGALGGIEGIEIDWPDGQRERFAVTETDRQWTLVQGSGAGA